MKFKNYRNSHTNNDTIYSKKNIADMSVKEAFSRKDEIMAQYGAIGIPSEGELQSSPNAIWVEAYTRDDGTEVKGHWRSRPEGSSAEPENHQTTKNVTEDNEQGSVTVSTTNVNNEQNTKSQEQYQQQTPVLDATIRKEEKLYPKEIAGVKRGKPMSFEEAGGNNVNPYYDDNKDNGYSKNCSICNVCFDARLEGFDVEALPFDEKNKVMVDLSYHPNNAYIDSITGKPPSLSVIKVKNAYQCHEWLESNIKQGEQYSMGFQFKEEKIGHILRVFKDDKNEIVMYDPQRSRMDSYTYLNKINFKSMRGQPIIFRTDDKQINYEVLKHVVKPH